MSLDISLVYKLDNKDIYVNVDDIWELSQELSRHFNITHNLGHMASKCGLYTPLWRPYRLYTIQDGTDKADNFKANAGDLIPIVTDGLKELKENPKKYKTYNPSNGWGNYDNLVEFTERYLKALRKFPAALVEVSR